MVSIHLIWIAGYSDIHIKCIPRWRYDFSIFYKGRLCQSSLLAHLRAEYQKPLQHLAELLNMVINRLI